MDLGAGGLLQRNDEPAALNAGELLHKAEIDTRDRLLDLQDTWPR